MLSTPHGEVPTPTFMPVGTAGSVKTLTPQEVEAIGAGVVLGNTYHLWLRPGPEIVSELGASWLQPVKGRCSPTLAAIKPSALVERN